MPFTTTALLTVTVQVMDFVMEEVEKGLHTLLEKIKPALEQVLGLEK